MDDNDICPLCCEELDISDQQFFPCKCGYQICMWCWHRIKESESGLCPACRTPYGDDPHEFSAVDMEEVVKANKEKAAAEKRERERLRAQQAATSGVSGAFGVGGMHIGGGSDGDVAVSLAGGMRGLADPPKDRNQLAVMRVIRRNLVYAVGLPPSIATEDILRKPEFFGQYGKIAKIVLNKSHNGNGDARRASASAYVTFTHKEDALACILALDGFYMEGRNIRASYGTSKYCSAFIKNVRCNNPDCTYLHCMGDSEDTFTKQEIQAGYVTSGRDVLAKQQQLAAGSNSSRRRVGSGGPSGTGKVAANPVFPPPIFEEQTKPSQSTLVPPPPLATSSTTQFPPVSSAALQRSTTSSGIAGFSAVAAGSAPSLADVAKMSRSVSVPTPSTTSTKTDSSMTPAEILSRQQEELRKKHPQNNVTTVKKLPSSSMALNQQIGSTTAASIVAGVHSSTKTNSNATSHTTLTALTPLKRATSLPEKKEQSKATSNTRTPISTSQSSNFNEQAKDEFITLPNSEDVSMKLSDLRNDSTALDNESISSNNTYGAVFSSSKVISGPGVGSIGGQPIEGSVRSSTCGPIGFGHQRTSSNSSANGILHAAHGTTREGRLGTIGSSGLGPTNISVVGGDVIGGFNIAENNAPVSGGSILPKQLLAGIGIGGTERNPNGTDELFRKPELGPFGGSGLWDQPMSQSLSPLSSNVSGTDKAVGGPMSNSVNPNLSVNNISGTSALASMLGIELPTGVGSLRETLWASSTPLKSPSPETKPNNPAPIGSGVRKSADHVIIGGPTGVGSHSTVPIGGYGISSFSNSGGNKSDIALLQSLLPGVHITSGNAYHPAAPNTNPGSNPFAAPEWGNLGPVQQQKSAGISMPNHQYARDSWNGSNVYSTAPGYQNQNNAEKQNQGNIW
mmetsp:Transcript_8551/g.16111  ORF Transcript_8551/g.16111 Transcript_8551/m.16111 type:complete len:907 (-) Transcript_8551:290-3010(-)